MNLAISSISPNPNQPRKVFDKAALNELTQSIREHGVIIPVVVEKAGTGYTLVDGERRLRASKLAGLKEIPAHVRDGISDSQEQLVLAMVANLQRADLGPIEEAKAYQTLRDVCGLSDIKISQVVGVSYVTVSSRLRLLKLEPEIQEVINSGALPKDEKVTAALLTIANPTSRIKMAQALASRNATVKACVEACQRLVEHRREESIPANVDPAMRMATIKAGPVNRPLWDALASVGRVPPWLLVEIAVRETCNKCSLRDEASATICRGCPLVEMLVIMVGRAGDKL